MSQFKQGGATQLLSITRGLGCRLLQEYVADLKAIVYTKAGTTVSCTEFYAMADARAAAVKRELVAISGVLPRTKNESVSEAVNKFERSLRDLIRQTVSPLCSSAGQLRTAQLRDALQRLAADYCAEDDDTEDVDEEVDTSKKKKSKTKAPKSKSKKSKTQAPKSKSKSKSKSKKSKSKKSKSKKEVVSDDVYTEPPVEGDATVAPQNDMTKCPTCPPPRPGRKCPPQRSCPPQKKCPPQRSCPPQKKCPTCPPQRSCPPQKNCPTCPPQRSCPPEKKCQPCPSCPPDKICPECPAAPIPTPSGDVTTAPPSDDATTAPETAAPASAGFLSKRGWVFWVAVFGVLAVVAYGAWWFYRKYKRGQNSTGNGTAFSNAELEALSDTNAVGTNAVGTNAVGTNVVGTNAVGTNAVGTNAGTPVTDMVNAANAAAVNAANAAATAATAAANAANAATNVPRGRGSR